MRRTIAMLIIAGTTSGVFGQYWGEQVLEKSFEKSNIFFHPAYLNPYGFSGFGSALVGVMDDPLLNLQINPAMLAVDSLPRHTFYTDFRNQKDVQDRNNYYYPWYGGMMYDSYCLPYPSYWGDSHKAQEPIFSGAYLFNPNNRIRLGVTYQMLSQDEDYYNIPQDIYKSNIGMDYNGAGAAEAMSIEITDRYSGQDEMTQEAHFLNAMIGLQLSDRLSLGLRTSRVLFDREGGYGQQQNYNWGRYYNDSQWDNQTSRSQTYDHLDLNAGLQYRYNNTDLIGFSAGYLKGKADQKQDQSHYSNSSYHNSETDWNHYYSSGEQNQSWKHDGSTVYGGFNFTAQMDAKTKFKFNYQYMKEDVDITLSSAIFDTSYNEYRYQWDYEGVHNYHSIWKSRVTDTRTGTGTRNADRHFITFAFEIKPNQKTDLYLGVHFEDHDVTTRTEEPVNATRFSDHYWKENERVETGYDAQNEKKVLNWDLKIDSRKFQIPIVFTRKLTDVFELMFGVNRTIHQYRITDRTLAVFDYQTIKRDIKTETKENFGERYTQPTDKQSNVTTSVLAGLTCRPSEQFDIRLLVVPQYTKQYGETKLNTYQWWIAFGLHY